MLLPGIAAGMLMMGAQVATVDPSASVASPQVDVASARAALGLPAAPAPSSSADDQIQDIVVT
ncbi:MAG TPA: hypothetical protein VN110_00285, partial [Sphingobium sp.]|nr:hypothetical protein [Sphingobium sp.]